MNIYTSTATALLFATTFSLAGNNVGIPIAPVVPIVEEFNITYIPYFALGYGSVSLRDDVSSESFDSRALNLTMGVDIGKYIGIEGRYRKSIGDMEYNRGDTGNKSSEDFPAIIEAYSLFANIHTTILDSLRPYLFVGVGYTELDAVPLSELGRAARSENSLQYGAGAMYTFVENASVFIDYTVLYDDEGFDGRARNSTITSDAITIGVRYDFQ